MAELMVVRGRSRPDLDLQGMSDLHVGTYLSYQLSDLQIVLI